MTCVGHSGLCVAKTMHPVTTIGTYYTIQVYLTNIRYTIGDCVLCCESPLASVVTWVHQVHGFRGTHSFLDLYGVSKTMSTVHM